MRIHSLYLPAVVAAFLCPTSVPPGDAAPAVVHGDGLTLEVPPPGYGVYASASSPSGTVELGIRVDDQGRLSYVTTKPVGATPGRLVSQRRAGCSDAAWSGMGVRQGGTWRWWVGTRGYFPRGIDRNEFRATVADSVDNITGLSNDCGWRGQGPTAAYQGYVARRAAVSARDGKLTCGRRDGFSVVSSGALDARALGVTCYWFRVVPDRPDRILEVDILLNASRYRWTTRPNRPGCSRDYDIESTMTHEVGHAYGLGHVSERSHGALTMSEVSARCDSSGRTLGRGDIRGLRSLY